MSDIGHVDKYVTSYRLLPEYAEYVFVETIPIPAADLGNETLKVVLSE